MSRTLLSAALLAAVSTSLSGQVAVQGATVYTMAGAPITNGVVLIGKDGKIEQVGAADRVKIPSGYRIITGQVVTPGLVDAHSTVGLSGILNYNHDQDQLEKSAPIQPELRALDAYNPQERLVAWLRGLGVTTVNTGHGPGALVSGQTFVVKTRGASVGEALVDSVATVAMTLGSSVEDNFKSPGTEAKEVAMLRAEFIKAREYARKWKNAKPDSPPDRDLRLDMMAAVLDGKVPALITAQRAVDILAALRLQQEFGFKLILDGAAEAYLVKDQIKAAGVPVIIHPTMIRTDGDTRNATLETAHILVDAGIAVALQSGFEGYVPKTRVVLFEAGMAAANGLTFEQALRTITIDAARIIGVGDRVGSLEKGKDGDVAVFDGDPFEWTSHVCHVVIQGEEVSNVCN